MSTVLALSGGEDTVRYSTGYPDLDLYYRQKAQNNVDNYFKRQHELMISLSTDSLILEYMAGRNSLRDTANLDHFFYYEYTPLGKDEQYALLDKIYDTAHLHKDKHLELMADLFKGQLACDHQNHKYEENMEWFEKVIRKAQKQGDAQVEARALARMWFDSYYSGRYARSFTYNKRLEETLKRVGDDYYYLLWNNFCMGMSYYIFKDYERAMPLLRKASFAEACNYIAVYHETKNNLDSAAYYNRLILTSREGREDHLAVHLAIAISNLGRIEQKKGNLDAAIAMLKAGLEYMEAEHNHDDSFISGLYISLGELFLEKGNLPMSKEYIDSAQVRVSRIMPSGGFDYQNRARSLYLLRSGYYHRLGEYDTGKLYQDSALVATELYEQLSGKHVVVLGEQQLQEAEAQLKNQRIAQQNRIILLAIVVLVVILATLIVTVRLYRRRNAAYKALAIKAKQWARNNAEPQQYTSLVYDSVDSEDTDSTSGEAEARNTSDDSIADDAEMEKCKEIMLAVEHEMEKGHAYREVGLTMETFAERLGVRRHLLSRAINTQTGGNFASYLNSYRIKEAIRIIGETKPEDLYLDDLSERIGFGNRSTFYRVFKQFTGLSPLEFQKYKMDAEG